MADNGGVDMADRICSIEGCDRRHYARTWCFMHYKRWWLTADPLGSRRKPPRSATEEHFWGKVDIGYHDECWPWMGADNGEGYGVHAPYIDGKQRHIKPHRMAYELTRGPIPEGLVVDHLCRNRCCVNPDHLEAVTDRTNWLRGNTPNAVRYRERLGLTPFMKENPMGTGQITSMRGDRDTNVAAPTVPPTPIPGEDAVRTVDGVITAIGPTVDLAKLDRQAQEVEDGVEYRVAYRDRDGVVHYEDVLRNHHAAAAERARFALKGERVLEVWVEKRKIADWEATDIKGLDGPRIPKASDVRKITRDGDA